MADVIDIKTFPTHGQNFFREGNITANAEMDKNGVTQVALRVAGYDAGGLVAIASAKFSIEEAQQLVVGLTTAIKAAKNLRDSHGSTT